MTGHKNYLESNGHHSDFYSQKTIRRRLKNGQEENLPAFLCDNEYIMGGYRPQIKSWKGCVGSIFDLHNETVNIWSHLLGSSGCLVLAVYDLFFSDMDIYQKIWFTPFFIGSVVCLGFSAMFHTCSCYSSHVHKTLAKFDYIGIIILIVSSFPPWLNYGFSCYPTCKVVYLSSIISIGVLSIFLVSKDFFSTPPYRKHRAALFMALGLTGVAPGLHFFYIAGLEKTFMLPGHGTWLLMMAAFYLIGGSIYAMRIPEKLWPGKFDIIFHSHQFLHFFVILGVVSCYVGISIIASHTYDNNFACHDHDIIP